MCLSSYIQHSLLPGRNSTHLAAVKYFSNNIFKSTNKGINQLWWSQIVDISVVQEKKKSTYKFSLVSCHKFTAYSCVQSRLVQTCSWESLWGPYTDQKWPQLFSENTLVASAYWLTLNKTLKSIMYTLTIKNNIFFLKKPIQA